MGEFITRGVRGTIPVSGPDFLRYGGRTSCLSVRTESGVLVLDAGTGISLVSDELGARTDVPVTILFSHFHHDHIMGIPCFATLYHKRAPVEIMADRGRDEDWQAALRSMFAPPYWPLTLDAVPAAVSFGHLPACGEMERYGIHVRWLRVPHPQQCLAVRMACPHRTVVFATDVEYAAGAVAQDFIDFIRGADILVFDAHFLPAEYPAHRGWGHSTWEVACEAANRAEIPRVLLTHHAPERTDAAIDALVATARCHHPGVEAARENAVF